MATRQTRIQSERISDWWISERASRALRFRRDN